MKLINTMFLNPLFKSMGLALLILTACNSVPKNNSNTSGHQTDALQFASNDAGLSLPDGFHAVVVAQEIGAARHIAIRDNGDIYVALNAIHDGHSIAALRDTTGDGQADVIQYFGDLSRGTGMRIHNGYLYFGSDTAVVRYKLQDGELLPDPEAELIASLPVQHKHQAKSIALDDKGHLYVNVGAPSNACQVEDRTKGSPGQDPCSLLEHHAAIWQFDADKLNQSQENGGTRFVTGTRNCVALDWDPHSQNLYAVMHGRDQLHQFYPQYYDAKQGAELPGEEFLLLKKDADYGWPYVYWDQQKEEFIVMPEYGGDGEKTPDHNDYEKPIMAFPGHWAPNGLHFYNGKQFPEKYQHGAFIAFHGSWNRAPEPQKGYKVVYVPFNGDSPEGDYDVFADGFSGTSEPIESPGDAAHRPCGLTEGPDGSLYVTDDANGTIFRIVYSGE